MIGYVLLFIMQILFSCIVMGALSYYSYGFVSLDVLRYIKFLKVWRTKLSQNYYLLLIVLAGLYIIETAFFITLLGKYHRHWINRNHHSHGTALFAENDEMKDLQLFIERKKLPNRNIVLLAQSYDASLYEKAPDRWAYKKQGKYMVGYDFDSTQNHLTLISSTRGGKGTGTIISTLLSWKDSVIVFDPKGENFQKTAGYRSEFSKIIRIDPSNPEYSHFNPLDFIRPRENLVSDAINFANIILPPNPSESQPYFANSARVIIALGILYVIFFEEQKTLGQVYRVLTGAEGQRFSEMGEKFSSLKTEDPVMQRTIDKCISDCNGFATLAGTTLSSCVSSAVIPLEIFARPTIDIITSDSYFFIDELVNGKRPVSIYLTVSVTDIVATSPLTRMIFSVINKNLSSNWAGSRNRKLLMMIDEFSQLGNFAEIQESISIMGGYGICYVLAIQSLSQLQAIYGKEKAKVFIDNTILSVLKIQDPENAKYFSDILGTTTLLMRKASKSGKQSVAGAESYSINASEVARPLMTPSEISTKPGDEVLVIIPSKKPYKAKRILYYEEPEFSKRSSITFSLSTEKEVFTSPHKDILQGFKRTKESPKSDKPKSATDSILTNSNKDSIDPSLTSFISADEEILESIDDGYVPDSLDETDDLVQTEVI